MAFWDKIFKKPKTYSERDAKRYEAEKSMARSEKSADRLKLAKNPNTHQEILYYIAQNDDDAKIRQAVAGNKALPIQASGFLARDKDVDVRLTLANRLLKLLPHLSEDKHSQLYSFAVDALGTLALDEVLKIRVALSSALKDKAYTPPQIAGQLARDIEQHVAEPILRFCVALSDDDLLDILATHPADWAVQAIAARPDVSENISHAVIAQEDVSAGLILMGNKGAKLATRTLVSIVEKSKNLKQWQKPIAMRKNLPKELALELAEFVDESVRKVLLHRPDFDSETIEEIRKTVRRRVEILDNVDTDKLSAETRVKQLIHEKRLNEEAVSDALALNDTELVTVALAVMNGTSRLTMEKIFDLKTPKPVLAVAWNAGLSMRLGLQLQKQMAQIPVKELIYPRGGTDYPLEKAELRWQLEFFGIAVQGNKA